MNMGGELTLAESMLNACHPKDIADIPEDRIGRYLTEHAIATTGEFPAVIGPHIEQWLSLTTHIRNPGDYSRCDELNMSFADLPFCL